MNKPQCSSSELNWVNCDRCNGWELFDNCKGYLGLDSFDEKVIDKLVHKCRMCRNDERIDSMVEQLEKTIETVKIRLEAVAKLVSEDRSERNVVSNKCHELDNKIETAEIRLESVAKLVSEEISESNIVRNKCNELDNKITELVNQDSEIMSKVAISELKFDEEGKILSDKLEDLASRTTALGLRLDEVVGQWPTPDEGSKIEWPSKNKVMIVQTADKLAFKDKYKNRASDSVMLVGDSMVRGVGNCLVKDSNFCSRIAYGGARIETITERLKSIGDKPETHQVVMVGTNNLLVNNTEEIMGKFEQLINEVQKHKFRQISFMGILSRRDVGHRSMHEDIDEADFFESKRLSINIRLKELCEKNKVGFIDSKLESKDLARDRLHLSELGQDKVARVVFEHCKTYLN